MLQIRPDLVVTTCGVVYSVRYGRIESTLTLDPNQDQPSWKEGNGWRSQ